MSFAQRYAQLYDAIYADKDYDREVSQILEFCMRYGVKPRTLIDYGCGTGNHAVRFADRGLKVYAVDKNSDMLAFARAKGAESKKIDFLLDTELERVARNSADVCTLLFDVLSYMTENQEIDQFLQFVASRLKPGGLFIFDFWYGPGVISLGPEARWKEFQLDELRLLRLTKPTLDWNNSTVDVAHEMVVSKGEKIVDRFLDRHVMRFFFKKEIEQWLNAHRLALLQFGTWQKPNDIPTTNDWSVLAVSRLQA